MKYSAPNNFKTVFYSFRLQLLTLILTPLLLAIFTTTLILWKFYLDNVQERKYKFYKNTKNQVQKRIETYVRNIEELSEINLYKINNTIGDIGYENTSGLETLFLDEILFNPYLTNIFYADKKRGYVSVRREQGEDVTNIFIRYRNISTKDKIYQDKFNNQGKKMGKPTTIEIKNQEDEPTNRNWYEQGKKSQLGWTLPYKFQSYTDPPSKKDRFGITFYRQIIKNSQTDQFQGVIALDLPLRLIEEYLKGIDLTKGEAKFFIFDCSYSNGSSESDKMIVQVGTEPEPLLLKTISSECNSDKEKKKNSPANKNNVHIFRLTITNLERSNWLLVIDYPNKYFYKQSFKSIISILGVSGLFIIIVIPASLFFGRRISRPITIITEAAQALESEDFDAFDNDSLEKIGNRNNELGTLAKVFLDMAKKVYKREQLMRQKLQELEETTNLQQKNSLLMEMSERQYLLQLIRKSQKNRQ